MIPVFYQDDPIARLLYAMALDRQATSEVGDRTFGKYYSFLDMLPIEWPNLFSIYEVPYDPSIVPRKLAHYILYVSPEGLIEYEEFSSGAKMAKRWVEITSEYRSWLERYGSED
jgi:hypothetical protein